MKPRDTLLMNFFNVESMTPCGGVQSNAEKPAHLRGATVTLLDENAGRLRVALSFHHLGVRIFVATPVQCGSEPHAAADVFSRGPS